jgi:hypothetical protein
MHAPSLPPSWHHWRERVDDAMHPHMADAEHPGPMRLSDNPMRARLRPVRLLPLLVPGMALVLVGGIALIGLVLRG